MRKTKPCIQPTDFTNRNLDVNCGSPFCFQFSTAVTLCQYGYDIRGLRRSAARASGTNFFIYDSDGNLLAETDADGVVVREYVYLDGQRLALFDVSNNDAVFYYLNDHLGTAQILLDNQGVVVWQGNYRPFGQVEVVVNNVVNYFRFPGQIFDPESGLHYNWNRYYDPNIGHYISPDPIGLNGGLNLYAYVGGDSVNYMDKMGLEEALIGIGGYLGGGFEFYYRKILYCKNNKTYEATVITICGGLGFGVSTGTPLDLTSTSGISVSSRKGIPQTRGFIKHETSILAVSTDVQVDTQGVSGNIDAGFHGIGTSWSYCSDTIISEKLFSCDGCFAKEHLLQKNRYK